MSLSPFSETRRHPQQAKTSENQLKATQCAREQTLLKLPLIIIDSLLHECAALLMWSVFLFTLIDWTLPILKTTAILRECKKYQTWKTRTRYTKGYTKGRRGARDQTTTTANLVRAVEPKWKWCMCCNLKDTIVSPCI